MARNAETKLEITQGADLQLRFRYKLNGEAQDLTEYTIKSQIREKVGGKLLLDLEPFFSVNPEDPTALDLIVPGGTTQSLKTDGVWDLFIGGTRLVYGPVNLIRSVSQ